MHAEGYKAVALCTHNRFMVRGSSVIGTHYTVRTESSYAVYSLLRALEAYGTRHGCYRDAVCTESYKTLVLCMQCSPMVLGNSVVGIC